MPAGSEADSQVTDEDEKAVKCFHLEERGRQGSLGLHPSRDLPSSTLA